MSNSYPTHSEQQTKKDKAPHRHPQGGHPLHRRHRGVGWGRPYWRRNRSILSACSSDRKPTRSCKLRPSRSTDQAMNLCPTILDNKRTTLKPSEFVQPLDKGGRPLRRTYRRARAQKPEDWKFPALLRVHPFFNGFSSDALCVATKARPIPATDGCSPVRAPTCLRSRSTACPSSATAQVSPRVIIFFRRAPAGRPGSRTH